jgi:hypothetical protein
MSELQPIKDESLIRPSSSDRSAQLALYDKYSSMAYGIILSIIPDHKIAQEVLLNLFASAQLRSCDDYPFSFTGCVIKLARSKALEAKAKVASLSSNPDDGQQNLVNSPDTIFDLSFRHGMSLELVAERLSISKEDVLKGIHLFFKANRPS